MAEFTERTLRADHSTLTAYDHGAHVAQWVHHAVPVVWVSQRSKYAADQAIRGGIPVCWPWFASGPGGDRKPSHGLARTQSWSLSDQAPGRLAWALSSGDLSETSRQQFPYPFDATMEVTLDPDAVQVTHTVTNTGARAFTYEIALHTYLHVSDVRDVQLLGLDGADYYDKVATADATQSGPLRIDGEVDRIYDVAGPVRIEDSILERVITVTSSGGGNVVVWNPGPSGAATMSDFGNEEWTQMVCVETANVGDHAVALEPGRSHATAATITVSA
ncbi:MAG: D-hexose-6-phosphate mutarotase [Ornithinimicrobium sp.]